VAARRRSWVDRLIRLLEKRLWGRLADLFVHRGVALPEGRSGLQRMLCWQREREGVVAWLTKPQSPGLRVDLGGVLVQNEDVADDRAERGLEIAA
jgi:hypothetical protein